MIRATALGDHLLTTTPATAGELRMTAIAATALGELRLSASPFQLDAVSAVKSVKSLLRIVAPPPPQKKK